MQVGVSFLGTAVLLAFGVLLSRKRRAIRLRTVGGAFVLQLGIGAFVLWVPWGKDKLMLLTDGVNAVISAGGEGATFLFGSLTDETLPTGFLFAFKVLPIIIFFSALISVLYYMGAMLLAFTGLIAVLNLLLSSVGAWFNHGELSLELILGWVFAPVAWLIGIPWGEAMEGGSYIGNKLIFNEFLAYMDFAEGRAALSERTQAIITFALCGFANLSSIAILIGGLGGMAPGRRKEIARLGLLAVAAATLSNLMSATIAGVFLGL